jgi:hypothetical protein
MCYVVRGPRDLDFSVAHSYHYVFIVILMFTEICVVDALSSLYVCTMAGLFIDVIKVA